MLFEKTGFPEEDEIVIGTVKKILHSAVFVRLDEYNRDGMINIAEVSPGRIRNLRDYVTEGKKIICKVLRISREKGHIDLSLRRVNQAQRINKNKEYKNEIKADRIIESVAKELKKDFSELKNIGYKFIEKYGNLYEAFQEISENNTLIKEFNLDKKIEETILKTVNGRIKPEEIEIKAKIEIKSVMSEGVEDIKKTLKSLENENVEVKYLSAPNYSLKIKAKDYKKGESILKDIKEDVSKESKKYKFEVNIEKQ